MKKKRWIVFRVVLCICVLLAISLMIDTVQRHFEYSHPTKDQWIFFGFTLLIPITQIAFQIINSRLLLFFLPSNLSPGNALKTWHTVLLILNSICVFLFFIIILVIINNFKNPRTEEMASFTGWQKLQFGIITSIIVLNLYTIIASLQLRSYLCFNQKATEEALLNSIGKEQTEA